MRSILRFLSSHRWLTALLIAGYLWLVMTNHQNVQNALRSWQYDLPRGAIGNAMYYATIAALAAFGVWLLRFRLPADRVLAAYGALGVGLAAASYAVLMFNKTELPHFPQYALMAFLVYPLCGRAVDTVWWATCLGAVDEWYQWQILFPDRPGPFDFNDVFLNTVGAILGVVILMRCLPREPRPAISNGEWAKRLLTFPAVRVMFATLLAAFLLYGAGKLALYPGQRPRPWIVLARRAPHARWIPPTSTLNKAVFEMRPLDGAMVLLFAHLAIAGLDRRVRAKF